MTQIADPHSQRRLEWVDRVGALADQVEQWCRDAGWAVERETKTIREQPLGEYTLPLFRISMPGGEIHVNPIGLNVIGGNGRVDIEAFPALSRVKLLGDGRAWTIMTDSNIPLRRPWDSQTFEQLSQDLLTST